MNFIPTVRRAAAAAAAALLVVNGIDAQAAPAIDPVHGQASWTLDAGASELHFVTTKNTNVAEVQAFKRLDGAVFPDGAVRLTIDLSSVETRIPLRNERLQNMLFEIAKFPVAQFDGEVDMARVRGLEPGASLDLDVAGKLSLHGQVQDAAASLRVVKLRSGHLLVATRAPILVNAAKFDLAPGIEQLRVIMSLPNIVGTVPVDFSLEFQQ
jgi:polyisoprenoid-binding protein YceI